MNRDPIESVSDARAPVRRAASGPVRIVVVALLLIVGLQLSLILGGGAWPPNRRVLWALLVAAAVGLAAGAAPRRARRWLAGFRAGVGRGSLAFAGVVFITALAYLYLTAVGQWRSFTLKFQDEFSYAIQAQLLARARLWMPAHPLADFFDSFQLLTAPVYASIYFPGAGLFYAPGVWSGAPPWLIPLILSAGCVGLMFAIARRLFGLPAAVAAAVAMVSLTIFRLQSIMLMAQVPALLCGLVGTYCWLRGRTGTGRGIWSLGIGAALGWAAVTRPVDALCFGLPIGLAMLVGAVRSRDRRDRAAIGVAVAAAVPFLALQLVANRGITGSWTTTPFSLYAARDYPGTQYGFGHYRPGDRPQSRLPQKQAYYETDVRPILENHRPIPAARRWIERHVRSTILQGLPHALLIVLLPVGVLVAVRRAEVRVVVAPAVLFPVLYWPYAFFLSHYTLVAAPALLTLMLAGWQASARIVRSPGPRLAVGAMGLSAIVGISIAELPEFSRENFDEYFPATGLAEIDARITDAIPPGERAIVLFRYPSIDGNPHEEPVYNWQTPWPDSARVIRAHDLGEENLELYRYYADRDPARTVWLYDRGVGSLSPLGRVVDLAEGTGEPER